MESWAILVPVIAFFVAAATLANGVIRMLSVATGKPGIKDAGEAIATLLTGAFSAVAFVVAANAAAADGAEYPPLVLPMAIFIAVAIIGMGIWGGFAVASRTANASDEQQSYRNDDPKEPTGRRRPLVSAAALALVASACTGLLVLAATRHPWNAR